MNEMQTIVESPAFVLRATGVQGENKCKIYWKDLVSAQLGQSWEVNAGGELFIDGSTLQVVYTEEGLVVCLLHEYYSEGGLNKREKFKLLAFVTKDRQMYSE